MPSEIAVNGACDATLIDRTCTNSTFLVRVQFQDSGGSPVALDGDPLFTVTSGRTEGVVYGPTAMTLGSIGLYEITLTITDWNPGLYRFVAAGAISGSPVQLEGAFNVIEPTVEQQIVYYVKNRLHDIEPELYKLDLPVPKWSEDQIFHELGLGLNDLATKPPMPNANLTYFTAPTHLLVEYAWARCLQSAAVLENWNTYTMGDGSASLTINRTGVLQSMGEAALRRYDEQALAWKKSLRPRSRGIGTALFPLQIRRAIGFLPNMKQVFGP